MDTIINELRREIDQFNQLVDGLKMQNKRLHGKINNLEEELDLVSTQRDSLAEDLHAMHDMYKTVYDELNESYKRICDVEDEKAELEGRIASLEK